MTEGIKERDRAVGGTSLRTATWLAWSLCALSVALLVGGVALARTVRSTALELPYGSVGAAVPFVLTLALVFTFSVVGAIVASRHPGNTIGWIFCTVGLEAGLGTLAGGYAEFWLASGWGSQSLGATTAWFASWAWVVQTLAVTFLLLLFPDGRLPSPRWRPVAWLAGLGIGGLALGFALEAGPLGDFPQVVNPYGIDSPIVGVVQVASGFAVLGAMVASAISVIVRARRAGRVERQQIKWLAYGGAVVVGTTLLASLIAIWSVTVSIAVINLAVLTLPVLTGIAIVRYRLYDIDIIINRTLVYGALTVLLAAGYVATITAFQGIGSLVYQVPFRTLIGQESALATVAATLAMAALFNPLRRRIQSFIDRSFYRNKYDAAKTLEAFSMKLRDETDLDALSDDLVRVVRETMQPAHVSLWLRPETAQKGKQPE